MNARKPYRNVDVVLNLLRFVCSVEAIQVLDRSLRLEVMLHLRLCNGHDCSDVLSEQPMAE